VRESDGIGVRLESQELGRAQMCGMRSGVSGAWMERADRKMLLKIVRRETRLPPSRYFEIRSVQRGKEGVDRATR